MNKPWLTDPYSLDAQIALARAMWHTRLLVCHGDQNDPTLIALAEIVMRLMRSDSSSSALPSSDA